MALFLKRRILDLLSMEKAAILAFDYEVLTSLILKKENIFRELKSAKNTLPRSDFLELNRFFQENSVLIEASLSGLKASIEVIKSAADTAQGMKVYSKDGEFVSDDKRGIEKLV